jgi:DNA-binding transcriptional LysR family regulator
MLRLSLDALQVIEAIDRRGTFSAAARELNRVPSTISYTVSKLEDDLGLALFERHGPRVLLTAAGRELLREGRHLLKAAHDLEQRVRRVAGGWETEFAIGLDSMFPAICLQPEIADFCVIADQTRLRIARETLSGTWEALLDNRVDLLVAAAGDGPSGGGYVSEPMGTVEFVFAVAPNHPLAQIDHALGKNDLQAHRAIVAADSARRLAPRTVGILFGQDTLTVPDMDSKLDFQLAGLGFGFLPWPCARRHVEAGTLVVMPVEEPKPAETFHLAWRSEEGGEARAWWLRKLRLPGTLDRMLRVVENGSGAAIAPLPT